MLTRREFVSVPLLYLLARNLEAFASDTPEVFPQGVASGDPTQDSVVLWTRIEPKVHESMKRDLVLEISTKPDFSEVVQVRIPADRINPSRDYTVRLTIDGLKPGGTYYYRFVYADVPSLTGRFKTLPVGSPEEFRFAFVVCQNYADGYYSAFRHISQEDVGFVVHLGDQIYEKIYGPPKVPGRDLNLPSGGRIALTLEDYLYLYRTYLSDKDYQLARAMHPFIYIWDDHEYANDYSYDYEGGYYLLPRHPFYRKKAQSLALRRIAIQAWLTYTPTKVKVDLDSRDPLKWITIYRDFKVGDLLHLICTDERSYRTPQPCEKRFAHPGCPEQRRTSMLGKEQKAWFFRKLEEKGYHWKVWANEVQFVQGRVNGLFGSLDAWDGYAGEREEILRFLESKAINNLVIITGDRHAGLVAEVPDKFERDYQKVLAMEFITPALSSISAAETTWWRDYGVSNHVEFAQAEKNQNPWTKYLEHKIWGYSVLTLTRDRAVGEMFFVDKYRKDAEKKRAVRAVYERGKPITLL
jgi:alkaline phosphatase D